MEQARSFLNTNGNPSERNGSGVLIAWKCSSSHTANSRANLKLIHVETYLHLCHRGFGLILQATGSQCGP